MNNRSCYYVQNNSKQENQTIIVTQHYNSKQQSMNELKI